MGTASQFRDTSRPTSRELLIDLLEVTQDNNLQLRLLNERIEAAYETLITQEDLDHGNDTGC